MFKEFKFRKNSWHARLMKYTWNLSHKDFQFMCPYFWLSVFNVIIAPVFLPIKFTLKTLIAGYAFKYICMFVLWCWRGIKRWLEDIGEYFDRKAVEAQERWEQKRKEELKSMHEVALQRIKDIPEHILDAIERANSPDSSSYSRYEAECRIKDYGFYIAPEAKSSKPTSKKFQRWTKWFQMFVDLHKIEPETFDKILEKRDELIKKIQESKIKKEKKPAIKQEYGPAFAFAKLETDEEKRKRLEREVARQEQEEIRKNAAALKKVEDEKKAKLRAEWRASVAIQNKLRINRILKVVKPIATIVIWIVGVCVALVGLFFLYKGILIISHTASSIPHSSYIKTGRVLKWIGLGILGVSLVGGFIWALSRGIIWVKENVSFPKINIPWEKLYEGNRHFHTRESKMVKRVLPLKPKRKIGWKKIFRPIDRTLGFIISTVFKGLYYVFIWPFKKAYRLIVAFLKIVKQTYKNECPPITWED